MMTRLSILLVLVGSATYFAEALLQPDIGNIRTRSGRQLQGPISNSISNGSVEPNRILTALSAEKKKIGKAEGVYVRPSGAIEKGSGFFVPGLEGPKVRLVIGLVLLGATAVNHLLLGGVGSFGNDPKEQILTTGGGLSFSEKTAVVYSLLLLFQSAIEYAKEALPETYGDATTATKSSSKSTTVSDNTEVLEQKWSGSTSSDESYRSSVQWAAASYLSMTPTTQILLLTKQDGIRYRLGSGTGNVDDAASGVSAALEELSKSKGGRIALPLTHPAATSLLGTGNEDSTSMLRTVILQRITDDSCFMVSSDQLLAGYTGGDLKWLGKLAGYVADSE